MATVSNHSPTMSLSRILAMISSSQFQMVYTQRNKIRWAPSWVLLTTLVVRLLPDDIVSKHLSQKYAAYGRFRLIYRYVWRFSAASSVRKSGSQVTIRSIAPAYPDSYVNRKFVKVLVCLSYDCSQTISLLLVFSG